jgi:hypothetical protein
VVNGVPDAEDAPEAESPGEIGSCPETGFELVARRAAPRATVSTDAPKKRRRGSFWLLRLPYDRTFHPAVVRGHLSIWQAIERGKRADYALRIAGRYGLSFRRAILVTDNRLTIARALGLTGAVPYDLAPYVGPQDERSGYKLAALAAAMLLAMLFAAPPWLEREASERPDVVARKPVGAARPARAPVPSIQVAASVRIDPQGRPTEVIAHTPGAVVEAYCQLLGPPAKPGRVVASGSGWIGFHTRDGQVLTIQIKRDRTSGGWRVGDGRGPIVATVPVQPS